MIENLIGNLKSEVGGQIMSKANLPAGKLDQVFSIIGDVTKKEVGQQMTGGGLSNVMNLFSKQQNNPGADKLQSGITSGVVSGLVGKMGLSQDVSKNIAQIAIPALINMITKKNSATPDNDPSPLNELFGGAGAGAAGGMAKNILGKLFKK